MENGKRQLEDLLVSIVKGHRKGTYWLTYFRLESDQLTALNRQCQLSESILRNLFLKVDPRIVDVLVSHALAGPAALRRPPEPVAAVVLPEVEVPAFDEV